ncbi:hypothetical protein vBAbaPP1_159 [Acinetobacter phage vB_AbaM_P1]|nr:hypothetical protein vBAbaPP1_159 [Acinetobacter phage vB_AbaM_P1]WAX22641.1 hypothetical protein [Acinetobacter phage vB_AbaP_HB01]
MNAREFIEAAGVGNVVKALEDLEDGNDFLYTQSTPITSKDGIVLGFDCKQYRINPDDVRKVIGEYK